MRRFRRFRPRFRRRRRGRSGIEVSQIFDNFGVVVPGETLFTAPLTVTTIYLQQHDMIRTSGRSAAVAGQSFETDIPGLKGVKVVGIRAQTVFWVAAGPIAFHSDGAHLAGTLDDQIPDSHITSGFWVDGGVSGEGAGVSFGLLPAFGNQVGPSYFANELADPTTIGGPTDPTFEYTFPRRTLHRQYARLEISPANNLTSTTVTPKDTTQIYQQWQNARLKSFFLGDRDIFAHTFNVTNNLLRNPVAPDNQDITIGCTNHLVVRYKLIW